MLLSDVANIDAALSYPGWAQHKLMSKTKSEVFTLVKTVSKSEDRLEIKVFLYLRLMIID